MIDIIIPTWNHSHLTLQCLDKIAINTKEHYNLIWVDDGSSPEHITEVRKRMDFLDLRHSAIFLPKNKGPTVAINEGLKASRTDFIVVLNNDILVTEGWLGKLLYHMEEMPEIGIIAALDGNGCTNWKKAQDRKNILPSGSLMKDEGSPGRVVKIKSKGTPVDFFAKLPPLYYEVPRNIPFCCCMIRREAMEQVGFLDETMRVYGQDNDFNERMKIEGWKKAVAVDCYVEHLAHQTVKNVQKIKKIRNRDKAALKIAREKRKIETSL